MQMQMPTPVDYNMIRRSFGNLFDSGRTAHTLWFVKEYLSSLLTMNNKIHVSGASAPWNQEMILKEAEWKVDHWKMEI